MPMFNFRGTGLTPDARLSRRDASQYLGLSERTLANRASQGLPPRFHRVSNRIFYYVRDLQAFVRGDVT